MFAEACNRLKANHATEAKGCVNCLWVMDLKVRKEYGNLPCPGLPILAEVGIS
jgi:hypothetical protein